MTRVSQRSRSTASGSARSIAGKTGAQTSLVLRVGAAATSGPFAPNGIVNVTDNRGGRCSLTLRPVATPSASSEGSCVLINSGAPGAITITASLNAFRSVFASTSGANVTAIGDFIID